MHILNMLPAVQLKAASPQQTPEWYQSRIGKLTASNMAAAMSYLKNGKESAERAKLKMLIVAERLTDIIIPHYVTEAMAWGIATEAEAKEAAAKLIGLDIKPCGFYDHPEIDNFGATPDGLLDDDGLIEIKCPTTTTHLSWLLENKVPDQHRAQMAAQLLCTGRRYCKFMSYDPRVSRRAILYKHYAPSQAELGEVRRAAVLFLAEVEALFERVSTTT